MILASLYSCGLFVFTVSQRIAFPAELEHIEGSVVNQVLRIEQGQPLYTRPSFEYAPNLYTPLYYYVAAGIAAASGTDFTSARIVSVIATLATVLVCGLFVYRETRSITGAIVAGGMYLATYAASGAWMDLARVDALFVMLLFAAVYVWRGAITIRQQLWAALLFVLAFYAKQSALLVIVACVAYAILFARDSAARQVFPLATLALLAGSLLVIDVSTGHWFSYYTLVMPAGHPDNPVHVHEFWQHDVLEVLPVVCVCAVVVIAVQWCKHAQRDALFLLFFLVAMLVVSYLTRINKGGYYNNLMPLHACLAIFAGLFVSVARETRFEASAAVHTVITVAVIAQFCLLSYAPGNFIPGHEDVQRAQQLIERLRGFNGNVYSRDLGFIGYQAGKQNYAHNTTLGDIWLSRYRRGFGVNTLLPDDFEGRVAFMRDGLRRNNIVAVVVVGDVGEAMPEHSANYTRRDYDPGVRASCVAAWWNRAWPVAICYKRPAIGIYIRDDYDRQAGQ